MQSRFYVEANGVKLHYLEFGTSGPDVVLLPGITSPAIQWAFVGKRIGEFSHAIVLDNRGRGLSDHRPGLGYTLDDYAADSAGLVAALGLFKPLILGHSMGARIGIRMAARYPMSLDRLILADPPVSGPGRRPYPSPLQGYLDRMEAASRGVTGPLSNRLTPETPEQVRLRTEWLPTCSREAVIESHRGFHDEDVIADLPHIVCTTLLLYAELDGTITDDEAGEIMGALRHGTARKLHGVGHLMPWFDLDLFIDAVRPFILGES